MTSEEYNEAVRLLRARVIAERRPGDPAGRTNERRADLELSLEIDYRLGEDFPDDRRESLSVAHRAMRRELVAENGRHVRGEVSEDLHYIDIDLLFTRMKNEFSRILTDSEYRAFFGVDPA